MGRRKVRKYKVQKQKIDTDKLLDGLNPAQKEVVQHTKGPLVTCATAGSGKTESMVRLIAMIVATVTDPIILATTFTVKAAAEMTARLKKKFGCTEAEIRTIHATCFQCINDGSPWACSEDPDGPGYHFDEKNNMQYALKDVLGYRNMDWKGVDITEVQHFIGYCKDRLIEPEDSESVLGLGASGLTDPRFCEAYFLYEEERNRRGLITFDDMIMLSVKWLRMDKDAYGRWSHKFTHVIVDEFQDTNLAQYEFVKILAENAEAFVVVGDDDQSIYEWRGAVPHYMIEFEKTFNAKAVHMETNYRSQPEIIETANRVIANNKVRIVKNAVAHRPSEGGERVSFMQLADMDDEADWIADQIDVAHQDGSKWGDFAIVYRTNAQSRALEEEFIRRKFPYVVVGGQDFYKRKEIKEVLAYVRVALDDNEDDWARLAVNRPFRFIGKKTLEKIDDIAHKNELSFFQVVMEHNNHNLEINYRQHDSLSEFVNIISHIREDMKNDVDLPAIFSRILKESKYEEWLLREEGSDSSENSRISNLKELVRSSARFKDLEAMMDYIDKIEEEKKKRKGKQGEKLVKPNLIQLMSIHKAKGLEFNVVFLAGAADGIIPHARTNNEEEERRLFYVACTRARDRLYITAPASARVGEQDIELKISPFVYEAGVVPPQVEQSKEVL